MTRNSDTQAALEALLSSRIERLDTGPENGLAKLVLSLVNLVHQLLEAQTLRRAEEGTLNDEQLERLGKVLMHQALQIEALCTEFGLSPEDLNIDLGPLSEIQAGTST